MCFWTLSWSSRKYPSLRFGLSQQSERCDWLRNLLRLKSIFEGSELENILREKRSKYCQQLDKGYATVVEFKGGCNISDQECVRLIHVGGELCWVEWDNIDRRRPSRKWAKTKLRSIQSALWAQYFIAFQSYVSNYLNYNYRTCTGHTSVCYSK